MANGTGLKERTKMKLRGCDGVPVALEAWPRRMTLGWCPLHWVSTLAGMLACRYTHSDREHRQRRLRTCEEGFSDTGSIVSEGWCKNRLPVFALKLGLVFTVVGWVSNVSTSEQENI